jgi:aldose sugar dehydrogenase
MGLATDGERFDYRDQAQDLSSGLGKIIRINPDGSVPRDNPFVGRNGARSEIWPRSTRRPDSSGPWSTGRAAATS